MQNIEIIESDYHAVLDVFKEIPEVAPPPPLTKVENRCKNVPHLALIAIYQGIPIGCKLGFEKSAQLFYSWIGGILPEYRKRGAAQQLLDYQEEWSRRQGYTLINVKSMNRFPDMMRFLIKNQYLITGTEGNGPDQLKVCFEKSLQ